MTEFFLLLLFSRCLYLLVEVFIKVSIQSVLAMTLKEDERFNSLWLWLFEFGFANSFIQSFIPSFADSRIKGGAKISKPILLSWRYFFLCAFSRSDPDKNYSVQSKLPTFACWSREKREERCEANYLCVSLGSGLRDSRVRGDLESANMKIKRERERLAHYLKAWNRLALNVKATSVPSAKYSSPREALNLIFESEISARWGK